MAVLVGKNEIQQASGGTTIVATLPTITGGILANDVIIVAIQNGTAASNITENTTTEYTEFGTQVTNDTQRVALFRKIASGSDVSRTFNLPGSGANSDSICIVSVFRFVDVAGDPIRAVTRTDYAAGGYAWENNSGTLSATDGDLLVFLNVQDGVGKQRYLSSRVMFLARKETDAGNGSMVMGMRQITATATTTAEKVYCTNTEGGTGYVFALKNASGGARQPMIEDGSTVLSFHGSFADASTTSQQKWSTAAGNVVAPNVLIPSGTLAGIGISSTAAAVTIGLITDVPQSTLGLPTKIDPVDLHAGIWGGAGWQLPGSPYDMSNKIWRCHFKVVYSASRIGTEGVCVVFADTGGKWAAYTLATGAAIAVTTERVVEIALGNATLLGSSETPSTIDWTAIKYRGFLENRVGSSASTNPVFVKDELLLDTCVVTGGGAAWPANWSRVAQALVAWEFYKLADLQGGVQAVFKHSVQIGDNSRPTYWDSPGGAFAFPTEYSKTTAFSQMEWNVDAGVTGISTDPLSTDTIHLSSGSAYTETQQALTFGGSASAATSVAQSFVGFAPTLLTGETYTGATFSGCDTVLATGAELVGCTIKAPNSNVGAADAAISWTANSTTQEGNTIDITGSSAGYFASFGASITAIEWNNNTLTGTPNNAGADKFYSELASGTLTITTDGTGTALVAGDVEFVGGSTAVAIIAAPELYQSVTVSGAIAASQIHVADVDYTLTVSGITVTPAAGATYTHNDITWTVVSASITAGAGTIVVYGLGSPSDSGTLTKASGTGDASVAFSAFVRNITTLYKGAPTFPYTWTDSVAAAAARAIRLRVGYCQSASARTFIEAYIGVCGIADGSEAVSYNASQVADATYNTHALDGPAILALGEITVSDLGTDLITVDTAGGTMGWPTIYAAFVAWMASDSGIDDEIAYCDSPDPVNFIWENTRIKCPIGTALSVTDGWGRDSVTGLSITLWDNTGGAIGFSADHGIGYSTGSGLTTAQNAKLMALPAAVDIAEEVVSGITF